MWKQILAWQMKSKSARTDGSKRVQGVRRVDAADLQALPPAVMAAHLAGVATQREFAKMMW